jgi:Zn-dependent M28 family amino/carboxypeptidase
LNTNEFALRAQLRNDVEFLAGSIGERNVTDKPHQLDQAAQFIDASLQSAGYRPQSQWYNIGNTKCRNIEAEVPGTDHPEEVVIIGAHYDSVPESPGADDNASGVSSLLALARTFAKVHPSRTLRFVAFTNEEPPYFWTDEMGSLIYARKCRKQGDRVVAMLSLESVGFYTTAPVTQRYPAALGLFFPSTGDFVAFAGNLLSRSLVHQTLKTFRSTQSLPSIGASVPNAIPGAGWSDHWSFWQQGFPAIEITDTAPYRNPNYHTPQDTPDRLDYDRLTRFTQAMRTVIAELTGP